MLSLSSLHGRRLSVCLSVACLLSMTESHTAHAQDSCSDILASGVHNTYQRVDKNDAKSAYKNALCDDKSSLHSNGSSVGGGASYMGIGASGHADKSQVDQMASKYCSSNSSDLSDDDFHTLATQTIDPFIVDNWRQCMAGNNRGLFGNVDMNGSDLMLTLEWRGFGGVTATKIAAPPQMTGATCDVGTFKTGTELKDTVAISALCHRNGNDAVTFVFNTDAGSKVLKLSAIAPIVTSTRYAPKYPPGWGPNGLHDVVVTRTDEGTQFHFVVEYTAPAAPVMPPMLPGYQAPPWQNLAVNIYENHTTGGGTTTLPPDLFPTFTERYNVGDKVRLEFHLPSQYADPLDGWDLRSCIGTSSSCTPSPNLLEGHTI